MYKSNEIARLIGIRHDLLYKYLTEMLDKHDALFIADIEEKKGEYRGKPFNYYDIEFSIVLMVLGRFSAYSKAAELHYSLIHFMTCGRMPFEYTILLNPAIEDYVTKQLKEEKEIYKYLKKDLEGFMTTNKLLHGK